MLLIFFLIAFSDLLVALPKRPAGRFNSSGIDGQLRASRLRSWLDQTVCALLLDADYIPIMLFEMRKRLLWAVLEMGFMNATALEMQCASKQTAAVQQNSTSQARLTLL